MDKGAKDKVQNARVARRPKYQLQKFLKPALIVIVFVAIVWLGSTLIGSGEKQAVEKNSYQAVFLSNGQVYFGKIASVDRQHIDLNSIYYLQTQSKNGEKSSGTDAAESLENNTNEVKLIKLGNELHGPKDRMLISKDQVLFWENLKDDSKVSEAIKQYNESSED